MKDLFGHDSVQMSIDLLREYEPPEGYWLADSGGKDSCCVRQLALEAEVRFDAHYAVTTCAPPELIYFLRKHHPDTAFERPTHGKTIFTRVVEKGFPVRNRRWCCEEFKHGHGEGRFVLTGIRDAESSGRRARTQVETCAPKRKRTLHVIKHWPTDLVWWFIRDRGLPYCELYDQGWSRLGCVICPYEERRAESQRRWPKIWALMERAIKRRYERNALCQKLWPSAAALWDWWVDGHRPYPTGWEEDEAAMAMFFQETADA